MLLLFAPTILEAQARIPRVGILVPQMERTQSQAIKGLREELKALGYQEKKSIILETRNAKGDRGALQPAASELAAQKIDVIFTTGTRATRAAKSATGEIPIVFIHPADPVSLGLVKSMERSGTNLTGVAGLALQMTEKRLGLLKEIIPKLQRIHIFYDSNNEFSREYFALCEKAATRLGLLAVAHGIKSVDELKATMERLDKREGDAFFQIPDDLVENEVDFIFDTARQKKLPSMSNEEVWALKGAMAAYGPSHYQMGRQAAHLVDKVLKGQKPENVPIERASKFDLIINYRTANFIGVSLSPDILKRADKVIR
ncbi:MAG TPA: ABC transporter substrate-binding protein [Candidatus Binatia bacterium]|nr:ABC transporter substrate-binding protein [Candidatus Binatia bacterium]